MAPSELTAWLEQEKEAVDKELDAIAERARTMVSPSLADAVEYALSTRGKRIRPILCLAAYRAVGGKECAAIYRLAAALEIVHTYSLVHDDLPCMDDDDLRRGRPTVHRVFGVPQATLAGAALLPLAVRVLEEGAMGLGLSSEVRRALVTELCRAAGAAGMVGGQLRDLEAERMEVDARGLEEIHRAKTGALLTASLRLGGIAADCSPGDLERLTAYGEALGLAFQITDDILDVVGDQGALGKAAGRDERLRKASYPALFGVTGARALARARADDAKAALEGIASAELIALADYVVEREK
ncbi:MAG TPA: farnesyl diphosphate synthase [Longimicrobiaceae bacterium]